MDFDPMSSASLEEREGPRVGHEEETGIDESALASLRVLDMTVGFLDGAYGPNNISECRTNSIRFGRNTTALTYEEV